MTAKNRAYKELARIGKALSSPVRLEILDLLAQTPRSVDAVASEIGHSLANASHHLKQLHAARLVESERHGTFVEYRLAADSVVDLMRSLHRTGEARLAELKALRGDLHDEEHEFDPGEIFDLLERVQRGDAILIDVRPLLEYEAGHLPGAINVPPDEIDELVAQLPLSSRVVAYCRGPYCSFAATAVEALRRCGFEAYRLQGGITDFAAQGVTIGGSP